MDLDRIAVRPGLALVRSGSRSGWSADCIGLARLVALDPLGLVICCLLFGDAGTAAVQRFLGGLGVPLDEVDRTATRLQQLGVLVPRSDDEHISAERDNWLRRGWAAAFDFLFELQVAFDHHEFELTWVDGRSLAGSVPRGPIAQRFPQVPSRGEPVTVPLVDGIVASGLAHGHDSARLRPQLFVGVLEVEGVDRGWFGPIDRGHRWRLAGEGNFDRRLSENLPVSVGRADFDVDAVLLLVHRARQNDDVDPIEFASIHVQAGCMLARMEARAAADGLAFMAHYAARELIADEIGLSSETAWMMGAVAVGARHE